MRVHLEDVARGLAVPVNGDQPEVTVVRLVEHEPFNGGEVIKFGSLGVKSSEQPLGDVSRSGEAVVAV